MTEDLTETLAGLQRAMAAPLPSPDEMAAAKAADRAMAERITKARPGLPLHHAYAVLETLRTIQRVDAAKTEPERESQRSAVQIADLIGLAPEIALAVAAVQDELLPQVHRYRSAWLSARQRAQAYGEGIVRLCDDRDSYKEWMEEQAERASRAEQRVARIRAFLEDMAGWCSPHGVAADYSRRALDALDGVDPFEAIRAKRGSGGG